MKMRDEFMNTQSSQNRKTATTEGSNPEVLTNGKEIRKEYYDNGQLKSKGSYKNGIEDGLWECYWVNGRLWQKGSFKNGKQDGLWVQYDDNGQLKSKGSYKDGERDGLWEIFDENGQLERKGSYKYGKRDGLWKFYENGWLWQKGSYKNGKPEGHFHYTLMNAVIFRMVCEGWNKKELLDLVDSEFDYATKEIAEIDKEVA
ncbi:toxin-antitoxin system YwqK family antitoxin [Opitutaceae bacterium]|nr:toxin-antitoxin system YwqK family antitoxin [Opitutaceae bacterium]